MKINKDTKIKIPIPDLKKVTFKVPTLDKIKINKATVIKFFAMVPLVLFLLPLGFFIDTIALLIIGLVLIIYQALCLAIYLSAAKAVEEERILKMRMERIAAKSKASPPRELTKEEIEKARKMREDQAERERKRREAQAEIERRRREARIERERKTREDRIERERKIKEARLARHIAEEKRLSDMRERRYERDRQILEQRHSMAQKNSSNKLRLLENALEDVKRKENLR